MTADERNRLIAEKIGDAGNWRSCYACSGTGNKTVYVSESTAPQQIRTCRQCAGHGRHPLDFATIGPFMTVLWPWFRGIVLGYRGDGEHPWIEVHKHIRKLMFLGQIHLHLAEARDKIADAIAQGEGS